MSSEKVRPTRKGFALFKFPSFLMLIICALVLLGVNLYGAYAQSEAAALSKPMPALDTWFADLNAYHSRFSAYPPSLIELEKEIWIPARQAKGKSTESQLEHGPRMYLYGDYAYLYQRDTDASICSVWAIPQGARYKEGFTYYELITPKSITEWRGAALTTDQMRAIPAEARPTGEQMARLGMYKQREVTDTKKKRGLSSLLPF